MLCISVYVNGFASEAQQDQTQRSDKKHKYVIYTAIGMGSVLIGASIGYMLGRRYSNFNLNDRYAVNVVLKDNKQESERVLGNVFQYIDKYGIELDEILFFIDAQNLSLNTPTEISHLLKGQDMEFDFLLDGRKLDMHAIRSLYVNSAGTETASKIDHRTEIWKKCQELLSVSKDTKLINSKDIMKIFEEVKKTGPISTIPVTVKDAIKVLMSQTYDYNCNYEQLLDNVLKFAYNKRLFDVVME